MTGSDSDSGTDSSLVERCADEVADLHAFFELWFVGDPPRTRAALDRFRGVLADDFRMIQPTGLRRSRDGIVTDVFDAHGVHDDVAIDVSAFEPRHVGDGACLGTYEEWQSVGEERTGRISTVLFRRAPETPNGVEWVHLHETWLES